MLSDRDLQIIGEASTAAIEGPFFPDWEFATLMGPTRDQLRAVLANWPDDRSEDALIGVNNVLLHLGHQHDHHPVEWSTWGWYSTAMPEDLRKALIHWRANLGWNSDRPSS